MDSQSTQYLSTLDAIQEQLIDAKNVLRRNLRTKNNFGIITAILGGFIASHYTGMTSLNGWALAILWIFAFLFALAALGTETKQHEALIEKLSYRKELLSGVFAPDQPKTHFDALVGINIENLAEYYALVKVHTKKSFNAALFVSVSGFFLIVAGIVISFGGESPKNISYVATASGVVVEFISAVFFYLYSKTVRQLKEYHDSLLGVQNILLSFRLIETTADAEKKFTLVEKMIDFLAAGSKTNRMLSQ